jgi:hypothetical protein
VAERSLRLFLRFRLFSMPRSRTSSRERVKPEAFGSVRDRPRNRYKMRKRPRKKNPLSGTSEYSSIITKTNEKSTGYRIYTQRERKK